MQKAMYTILAGLFAVTALLAVSSTKASAATVGNAVLTVEDLLNAGTLEKPLLKKVQWGYCHRWRRRCARRWGWGTWRFRRCLRRHGCGWGRPGWGRPGWGYCRRWHRRCARRWGWGTWRYRRCLRRHGC